MSGKFVEYMTQIDERAAKVAAIFDEIDAKHNGEGPDDLMAQIKALNIEIADLDKRASDCKEADDLRAANTARREQMRAPVGGMVFPGAGSLADQAAGVKLAAKAVRLGPAFVESDEWQSYFKRIAPGGHLSDKTHVESDPVIFNMGLKAVLTGVSDTSAGAFVVAEQSGIYETLGRRPLMIRDIISTRTTGSDLIEYVRQTSRVNAAAPVAEATASGDGSGAKPEGGFAFERVQAPVKTIAEWVAATKRSIADAGQLRGIIDDELRGDLEQQLEDQVMTGDGVGEHFVGIDAVSGTQDQAFVVDKLQTTRKARTLVRTVGRSIPTAYVMNPTDWESIDLLKDNENRYYYGGPMEVGVARLWGLTVVESEAQPAGNAWVGDWKKAVLWDREQAMISVTDSHSDFFVRNLVAILGELRAAFGVTRPLAFVEVAFS